MRSIGDAHFEATLVNFEDIVSPQLRGNARTVGHGEIAWRGTDILAILQEIAGAGYAILGLESVVFAWDSQPQVEAVSDSSVLDRKGESWDSWVSRTVGHSIADLERNVRNRYGDDVWYVISAERGPVEHP